MIAPILEMHRGIIVVRDDLFPGGTKARFIGQAFEGAIEAVYASPAKGGTQTAIATVARALGKRATIFVASRANPHAQRLRRRASGAKVVPVSPGYLTVVQSRARDYCRDSGATLIPFGADFPGAVEAIAAAARLTGVEPDEVWCAAGSGVLARGLALAWPRARRHVVQIGRELAPRDVAGATIHVHPRKFGQKAALGAPFPADPHYDAKAWEICIAKRGPGRYCSGTWRCCRGPNGRNHQLPLRHSRDSSRPCAVVRKRAARDGIEPSLPDRRPRRMAVSRSRACRTRRREDGSELPIEHS